MRHRSDAKARDQRSTTKTIILQIVTLFLMFLFANVLVMPFQTPSDNPIMQKYDIKKLSSVYPAMEKEEIDQLLKETWNRPFEFVPFTQFKERSFVGKYVNVSSDGFRYTSERNLPWPPSNNNLNIFVFGGSTTFGYGVADWQSVPSFLQEKIGKLNKRAAVYNFGRGSYFSSQERVLFGKLLSNGNVPDIAIFIDGLNDFYYFDGKPHLTSELEAMLENGAANQSFWHLTATYIHNVVQRLPLNLFAHRLRTAVSARPSQVPHEETEAYNDPIILDAVIQRYLRNQKLIEGYAEKFKVAYLFVWQPIPTYNYDQKAHIFFDGSYGQHNYSKFGYPLMASIKSSKEISRNFVWCADIQQDMHEALYVDLVHYSPKLSEALASCIMAGLEERHLLGNEK